MCLFLFCAPQVRGPLSMIVGGSIRQLGVYSRVLALLRGRVAFSVRLFVSRERGWPLLFFLCSLWFCVGGWAGGGFQTQSPPLSC